MTLRIVAGTANRGLAEAVAAELYMEPAASEVERFPDGELRPVVANVRGADVYLVQPTGPPVNDHVIELLLLLDACRRDRAERVTVVAPYFGYARQDRRRRPGEAIGVRVMADALATAGARRLVVVDPHMPAIEAVCAMPADALTAVPVLADALWDRLPADAVVVAPDLGAVRLARHYARLLSRPVVMVRKTRLTGADVMTEGLVGEVSGRPALLVDDMITTGGTIDAAVDVLLAGGAQADIAVSATHGVLVEPAARRLARPEIHDVVVTDTLPQRDGPRTRRVCSIAPLLADAIGRLHRDEPLDELLVHA
ncbi:ribose-phosphate pyrophosphokinase [Microbispora corallina]|uniref:ribose-phosphate diphosphokinase n=1 Tax=Microbispora corallina TaxID=83302 RepID=A0ABQ4GCK5_9ACTN|nr:ribose-phosphate pyrophosphokinase [Microbispora corallina]GIH44760.1 ribose-phosphate pyrophosphokinase [Microbispora corallina]